MNWKNLCVSLLFIVGMEGVVLTALQQHNNGVQVAEVKKKCPDPHGNSPCPP